MTDVNVEKKLIEAFNTLNTFSGKNYINRNVAYPNRNFTVPANKTWFALHFLPDEPSPSGMGTEAFNRWNGIFQIDICTPLGVGDDEGNEKYRWISKLFTRGGVFDFVRINRCYRARASSEVDHYVTTVRVEWTADIIKE